MARIGRLRNLAFLFVLLGALANTQTSAFEEDCGAGPCEQCVSGSPCYVTGGDPEACNQWDESYPEEACDIADPLTFCSGGKVKCECLPCN